MRTAVVRFKDYTLGRAVPMNCADNGGQQQTLVIGIRGYPGTPNLESARGWRASKCNMIFMLSCLLYGNHIKTSTIAPGANGI